MQTAKTTERLDARARVTMALLYRRLLEMGIWRHIHSVGGAVTAGSGGAHFTTRDNRAFLRELLSKGRFCRDTPGGGLFHPGLISVREITDGPALHLSLAADNRIYVHIDRVSPAVNATPDGTCRYDRHRSLAHMRQEVFPLVMRSYRPAAEDTKRERRARLNLYDAQRAWCEAVEADRKEEAIEAGLRLAGLLAAEKESARRQAQTLYRQTIESGHPEFAPAAAFGLGALLEERNEIPGAVEAYRKALAFKHSEFAPWAAYNLGILMEKLGRMDAAEEVFQRAIALGHPDLTSWSALKLGDLLVGRGAPEDALEAYRLTISLRHPECASLGAIRSARLLESLGETESAEASYRQAIELGP
ncbi:MAG TPA: tetratricopeptide repeat protein, partial [Actinomycetota bacterium]|nr:tetratricopeptide repeat protein [Actinomycetota bacterium]